MANIFIPSPNLAATGLAGPYQIDLNDCIGDSVGIINANTNYCAAGVRELSATTNTLNTQINNINSQVTGVGTLLQTTTNFNAAAFSGSLSGPNNLTTIPSTSNGVELITQTITPKFNNSKIIGKVSIPVDVSGSRAGIIAFFRNAEANAFAADVIYVPDRLITVNITFFDTVINTSPITYKVRLCSGDSADTWHVNRDASGNTVSGLLRTKFVLQEIKS